MNKLHLALGSSVLAAVLAACTAPNTSVLNGKNAATAAVSDGGEPAIFVEGNISGDASQVCNNQLVNNSGNTWMGVKVDSNNNGSWTNLTATVTDGQYLSFEATGNLQVVAVVVKGGADTFVYRYDPAVTEDSGLRAPDNNGGNIPDISHYVICFTTGTPNTPDNGWVKVRKIYDFVTPGMEFVPGYIGRYDPAGQLNGEYDYPEPIFGGWPLKITPVDAEGNATGASMIVRTEVELDPTGGLYIELPEGRYKVEEIDVTTLGASTWVSTGANITVGGSTTKLDANSAVFVNVVAGAKGNAPVVRFFNVCEIEGEAADFDSDNLLDIRANTGWACSLVTEAQ